MSSLRNRYTTDMEVEEVLLDASNVPAFNHARLEGKRELPIGKRNVRTIWLLFIFIAVVFLVQIYSLQVVKGEEYKAIAENNRVDKAVIIAERGVVYDRTGELLVWNEADDTDEYDFPILFDFPSGHEKTNYPIILGRKIKLDVTKSKSKVVFYN